MNDALMMVTILLFLAVVGLIAVCGMLGLALSRDRRISSDLILRLTDRVILDHEDQLARINQESQERVAMKHIDATTNGQIRRPPVRPDPVATIGTGDED